MIGNNAICYEAIQRVFRNAVVDYLRKRMADIFPSDHIERLKRPFANEWPALVANAKACRESGGTETKIKDDYDLLSVGHFFSVFDSYYDKMFSAAALASQAHPKPVKAKLLGNLKAVKDLRDPLSHPVEEEISFEEAFGILTDVKQVLAALGFDQEAQVVTRLMSELKGIDDHSAENLVLSLPTQDSIYIEFIGRGKVLSSLDEWFSSQTNKRALLAGDGGKGKSAVAYRYAQVRAATSERYKLIAWLSAKRRRFEDGKTIPIDAADFHDLDSAINKLLLKYGVMPDDLSGALDDRKRRLQELLNDFPAFVVVDDIDTVLDDTELVNFFTFELPSTKSTVLVTSRRDIPGIKNFTIFGFEPKEAEDFIRSRVELYGLDANAVPDGCFNELVQATDGSPLYMDDLLRLVKIVPVRKAVEMWSEKRGDEARRYALQRELENLSEHAKKVLIAACVRETPTSFAELETVLRFSEDRLLAALTELQTLFLFPKPRVVEGEQRFEVNTNTRKLVRLVEGSSDLYARIETASKAVSGQLPDVGRGIISALIRQAYLLMNSSRFVEAETLLTQAAEKYPQAGDLEGFLGFLYRKWGRYADAVRHFEAAYKLKCKNPDTYRHWIKMEMAQKEWTRAISAADKALRILPDLYELHALRAECKVRSGQDLFSRLQREKAFKLWNEAVGELKVALKSPESLRDGERDISAWMYRTLVICLDCLSDFRMLKQSFLDWEREHPEDKNIERQREFILRKRGKAVEELAALPPDVQTTSRPKPF